MAKYSAYGQDAERLFVRDGKTIDEIHTILGLSRTTLTKWRRKDRWDIKRKAYLATPRATIDMLERLLAKKLEHLQDLDPHEIDQTVTDGLVKLMAAVRRARKEEHIKTQSIIVFARFGPFVRDREKEKERVEWLTRQMQAFFEDIRDE